MGSFLYLRKQNKERVYSGYKNDKASTGTSNTGLQVTGTHSMVMQWLRLVWGAQQPSTGCTLAVSSKDGDHPSISIWCGLPRGHEYAQAMWKMAKCLQPWRKSILRSKGRQSFKQTAEGGCLDPPHFVRTLPSLHSLCRDCLITEIERTPFYLSHKRLKDSNRTSEKAM